MKRNVKFLVSALAALLSLLSSCEIADPSETSRAGETAVFTAEGISFVMTYVPRTDFLAGTDDATEASAGPFWIGETEVTYELWKVVYQWATDPARAGSVYTFANPGAAGDGVADPGQLPVTSISWRDAIVWCNAATEWYNAAAAGSDASIYTYSGAPLRDSRDGNADACENTSVEAASEGFRLLTNLEWELAARFKADGNGDGDISDHGEYYPAGFASGATASGSDETATGLVAWYEANSGGMVHAVTGRTANALGLYDMSGNVWEWCLEWYEVGVSRLDRGGYYLDPTGTLQVGFSHPEPEPSATNAIGFRIARSAD